MMAYIEKKIEEIRNKPEPIRVIYVWGMVAAVMVLVVFVWIFTLRENLATAVPSAGTDVIQDAVRQDDTRSQVEKPSLQESFGAEGATGTSR
ncbi:MAG: hypothetical protein HGA31_01275 [Candidatus Moranbacteria bacterium]|nr:hypothetical protein [Candidatus Moranbacteria bacterium]